MLSVADCYDIVNDITFILDVKVKLMILFCKTIVWFPEMFLIVQSSQRVEFIFARRLIALIV